MQKRFVLGGLLTAMAVQGLAFTNDICLPSQMYFLAGERNEIFVKPFLKRWRPYDDFVRFSVSDRSQTAFLRRLSSVTTVTNPVEGATLKVDLVNGDEFETVKSLAPTVHVGVPGTGKADVYAQIVGDSFTHGTFFRHALLDAGFVPKLHLVGLCRVSNAEEQYGEGRGGWTLAHYFRVPKGEQCCYHGFMHPVDGHYWGDRAFWKMAWRCVRGTQPKGFQPTYSCGRFQACVGRFDEQTGTLLDPQAGDVQYDSAAKTMLRWDGAAWRPVDEKALDWRFDYGKYLAMWKLPKPQFLFEVLGLNDFGTKGLNMDYTPWAEKLQAFKESYLKACPGGKFVICTPCSACGSDDNAAGSFHTLENAVMWRFRDWLIKTFDRREKEGYYLLDVAVATDNDHGFHVLKDSPVNVPYGQYKGDESLYVQQHNPHPYPCYPSMSVPLAAFIQYWRDR